MKTNLDKAVDQAGRDIKSGRMDPALAIRKASRKYNENIHDIAVILGTRANNIKLGRELPSPVRDQEFIEGLCEKDEWERELDELDG